MNITEQFFVSKQQLHGLKRGHVNSTNIKAPALTSELDNMQVLSQQALVDAARMPHLKVSQHIISRVNTSLPLFKRYRDIVKRLSLFYSHSQAAAATNTVQFSTRKGEGFSLNVTADPDNSEQVYVVLSLSQNTPIASERLFLHIELAQEFWVVAFNTPKEYLAQNSGSQAVVLQEMMQTDSAEFIALCNTNSCLYLG